MRLNIKQNLKGLKYSKDVIGGNKWVNGNEIFKGFYILKKYIYLKYMLC